MTSLKKTTTVIALSALLLVGTPEFAVAEESIFWPFSTPASKDVSAPKNEFPAAEDREPRFQKTVIATAYSSDPNQTDNTPCIPAMGSFNLCEQYELHGIEDAIANNCLPLGTKVKFPDLYGDRVFTVRDRMNAKYGCNRVDFWVGSETPTTSEIITTAKTEARAFGVQRLTMEVFGK